MIKKSREANYGRIRDVEEEERNEVEEKAKK